MSTTDPHADRPSTQPHPRRDCASDSGPSLPRQPAVKRQSKPLPSRPLGVLEILSDLLKFLVEHNVVGSGRKTLHVLALICIPMVIASAAVTVAGVLIGSSPGRWFAAAGSGAGIAGIAAFKGRRTYRKRQNSTSSGEDQAS